MEYHVFNARPYKMAAFYLKLHITVVFDHFSPEGANAFTESGERRTELQ